MLGDGTLRTRERGSPARGSATSTSVRKFRLICPVPIASVRTPVTRTTNPAAARADSNH